MLLCSIQLCSQHVAVTHGHMCLTGCRSTLQEAGCDAHWSQKAWWRSQLAERLDASSGLVTCLSHLSCTACHQQQGHTSYIVQERLLLEMANKACAAHTPLVRPPEQPSVMVFCINEACHASVSSYALSMSGHGKWSATSSAWHQLCCPDLYFSHCTSAGPRDSSPCCGFVHYN